MWSVTIQFNISVPSDNVCILGMKLFCIELDLMCNMCFSLWWSAVVGGQLLSRASGSGFCASCADGAAEVQLQHAAHTDCFHVHFNRLEIAFFLKARVHNAQNDNLALPPWFDHLTLIAICFEFYCVECYWTTPMTLPISCMVKNTNLLNIAKVTLHKQKCPCAYVKLICQQLICQRLIFSKRWKDWGLFF
jgi:hypothetical protein